VGLVGAFLTTAYMTRATYLTFFGKPRGAAAGEHAHDAHGAAEEDPLDADALSPQHPDAHQPAIAVARALDPEAPPAVGGSVAVLDEDGAHGHDAHDAHGHDAHGAHGQDAHGAHGHDSHDDHHAPVHGFLVPTDSPALISVPIMILAFLAIVSGFLNAAPFS